MTMTRDQVSRLSPDRASGPEISADDEGGWVESGRVGHVFAEFQRRWADQGAYPENQGYRRFPLQWRSIMRAARDPVDSTALGRAASFGRA